MLIFIEGIDKAGKSTFIKNFAELTSIKSYRKIPPELEISDHHNFFKGIGFALVELHEMYKFDAIIDRSFISDWVYTNKYGLQKNFSVWKEWESRQKSKENFIIFVEIDEHIFSERISQDPDIYMKHDEFHLHQRLYISYFQQTSLPYVSIRGDIPFDEQLVTIKKWLLQSCVNYNFFTKINAYLKQNSK